MGYHFDGFSVKTPEREVLLDVTSEVTRIVRDSGIQNGVVRAFVSHTTAGITINENADPAVKKDIISILRHLVPQKSSYRHMEGNSDAHVKASLMGPSVTILVKGGKMLLGRWQGIMFCEFDGPRTRTVHVQVDGV